MKKLFILAFFFGFYSCGPSKEEQQIAAANQMAILDSTAKATEALTLARVAEEKATAEAIAAKAEEKNALKHALADAKTELRIAKEELSSIKEFQFGRSISDKEAQIANQYKKIQHWEEEMDRLQSELLND